MIPMVHTCMIKKALLFRPQDKISIYDNNRHRNENITHTLLKWLKHSTGTQVFGFFVSAKMAMPLVTDMLPKIIEAWLGYAERKEVLAKAESKSSLSQTCYVLIPSSF